MRISKALAVAATGCALVATSVIPATASSGHAAHVAHPARPALSHGTLHSHVSTTHVKTGTKITMTVSGAKHRTGYLCLFALVKGASANGPNLHNTKSVISSKKGKFKCTLTFKPFKASVAGKTRHCPLTKKDKKAKIVCGMAAADPQDQNSNAFWALHVS
jgi:hypothetical protein